MADWLSGRGRSKRGQRLSRRRNRLRTLEQLEPRRMLAVNVLTYHNDVANTGLNAAETQLTPANVKVGSFGKLFTTILDGNVYAEPLIVTGVVIANGPNTSAGAAGLHDVAYVATEHDTLFAIDAGPTGGAILWKRSFLTTSVAGNNTLGATAINAVPYADVNAPDISPDVGITGTPVIDAATQTLYVVTKTAETIGGVTHWVQRLHAIDLADGTDRVTPFLIGDTRGANINNTPLYVYGAGDGAVTDPYNSTGKSVVQFNALRENQRAALSLVNGKVYIAWASHADNGPYHGWLAAWDVTNLAGAGLVLNGVFNTSPNGGLSGIWGGGGRLTFEPDGSALYFETGNGPVSEGNPTLDANGFPTTGDYNEALVKLVADSSTTPTIQNKNGWGFKVADYFIPYNQTELDGADRDFGSASPLILPDSAGIAGHPHLMIASGKEGKIYVIDRDNLGKFDPAGDHVVNAVPDGSGHMTPPVQIGSALSSPAYYNGSLYYASGYGSTTNAYRINASGTLTQTSQAPEASFGYLPGSVVVSASGANNGIVWAMDRNANAIHAYNSQSLGIELWNSNQKAGGGDSLGAVVKFATPTVANGQVYVGTSNALVVYGLTPAANQAPIAPALSAVVLSGSSINLSWTDGTTYPNLASAYLVEQSTDGLNFAQLTTAAAGSTVVAIGGLTASTRYYFRIRGQNNVGSSAYSNVVSGTTTNQTPLVDYSSGFANSSATLQLNGVATIIGSRLELTKAQNFQLGTAFIKSAVDVTKFSTQFSFQLTNADADGFTFCLQGQGPTAKASEAGGGLGYAGNTSIANSVAIKFDLFDNLGEGFNSTGLYIWGSGPYTAGSIDLTPSGINLHSGNVFQVNMSYDGTTLNVILLDTQTGKTDTRNYLVNIPSITGRSAYVGFTGSTGGQSAVQDILAWTFAPGAIQAPNAPTALGATAASATSINLNWTNNAANQTGFRLDRATDAAFTQNLTTQILPYVPNSFTDNAIGLAPGLTFYYRLRSFNTAGDSGNSNVVSVSIPLAPAKPSNATVTSVSQSSIDLSWTDNAGTTATQYLILRRIGGGAFVNYALLPALASAPPSKYTWTDSNVAPGVAYEYHIVAINSSGSNDFAGANATTLTAAPANLVALPALGSINLSWLAVPGAIQYNVYRNVLPGLPATTPLATVSGTSFSDAGVFGNQTYYYTVTAINANINHVPLLPAESAATGEVSATAAVSTALDFSAGFANSTLSLMRNGSTTLNGSKLELTVVGPQGVAGTGFPKAAVPINQFSTQFRFQFNAGDTIGSGITFTIQNISPAALGQGYLELGYAGIGKSVAVKFDSVDSAGEGPSSTGIYVNGAEPTVAGSIDLRGTPIDLHSGHVFQVNMNYDGTRLTVVILDTQTGKSATQNYTINIPAIVGGNAAFVGFTGANGIKTATQDILSWTFANPLTIPAAPSTLGAIAGSPTTVNLNWTNNAFGLSGFHLDRATDAGFMQNVLTRTLPFPAAAFADTGLSGNTTYYYRLRAVNAAGDSASSNVAAATTPTAPTLDFSAGFANSGTSITRNGATTLSGSKFELTVIGPQGVAASAFATAPVTISQFSTQFNFQFNAGDNIGSGITFTIQGNSATALGQGYLELGYAGIGKSVAVKFDSVDSAGEGPNSTGIYLNGAEPTVAGSIDLRSTPIDLHSGHVFQVNMNYDGSKLTVLIQDTQTGGSATQVYTVNIPAIVAASSAYVGFTGANGVKTAQQDILNWTFYSAAAVVQSAAKLAAPTTLTASTTTAKPATTTTTVAANPSQAVLYWTDVATAKLASAGFVVERSTDGKTFSTAANVNATTTQLPLIGLTAGAKYTFRIRGKNAAGVYVYSAVATAVAASNGTVSLTLSFSS